MGSRHFRPLLGLLVFAVSGAGFSCATSHEESRQIDRAIKLIDQRKYEEVITLLEEKRPEGASANDELTWLLGQAHLGASGLEPMRVAGLTLGEQRWRSAGIEGIYRNCPAAAVAASQADSITGKCMFKRLANQLPDPENPHLQRALEIFRKVHPDARTTPKGRNVLIGMTELASALGRAMRALQLYRTYPPETDVGEMNPFFDQVASLAGEVKRAIERARQSPGKISRLLTGYQHRSLFDGADANLELVQSEVLPRLIELSEVKLNPEGAVIKQKIAEKMGDVLRDP